jgi:hypothetical protein
MTKNRNTLMTTVHTAAIMKRGWMRATRMAPTIAKRQSGAITALCAHSSMSCPGYPSATRGTMIAVVNASVRMAVLRRDALRFAVRSDSEYMIIGFLLSGGVQLAVVAGTRPDEIANRRGAATLPRRRGARERSQAGKGAQRAGLPAGCRPESSRETPRRNRGDRASDAGQGSRTVTIALASPSTIAFLTGSRHFRFGVRSNATPCCETASCRRYSRYCR